MIGKNSFSILTFNFLGIPFLSRNYGRRLRYLTKQLQKIQPDIICLQEVWLRHTRKRLVSGLEKYGYRHFFHPTSGVRLNGLLTCSKHEIIRTDSADLKPVFSGMNLFLVETPGSKGYSLVTIKMGRGDLHVINTHLSVDWSGKHEEGSKYNDVQINAIDKLAKIVNLLGDKKIIVVGDLNFRPDCWLYEKVLSSAGLKDIVPNNFETCLRNLFRFPMPEHGGRVDYIFTRNFLEDSLLDIKLLWDKPVKGVGYLSDHAAILARFRL